MNTGSKQRTERANDIDAMRFVAYEWDEESTDADDVIYAGNANGTGLEFSGKEFAQQNADDPALVEEFRTWAGPAKIYGFDRPVDNTNSMVVGGGAAPAFVIVRLA